MKLDQQTLSILWIAAVAAIFYFMILRPQQQRTRRHEDMKRSLKVGDKVVTVGGVHGTVKSIGDDTMTLQVSGNTQIVYDKSAIGRILSSKGEKDE